MTPAEVQALCNLTAELTRLRQNECKHLSIENFAPKMLAGLLLAYTDPEALALEALPITYGSGKNGAENSEHVSDGFCYARKDGFSPSGAERWYQRARSAIQAAKEKE